MFQGLAQDYYGPPRPGQSFVQYESFMSIPLVVSTSAVVVGALLAGPLGALAGGIGGWLISSPTPKNKRTTQGG